MNKREMKAELKEFLARKIFLDTTLQLEFAVIAGLEPMSDATQRRLMQVIFELRDEWIK